MSIKSQSHDALDFLSLSLHLGPFDHIGCMSVHVEELILGYSMERERDETLLPPPRVQRCRV